MDMPEKIAAWRFRPKKADEWINGGWSEDHDHKTTEYTRSDLAVEVKPLSYMIDVIAEKHRTYMSGKGYNPDDYISQYTTAIAVIEELFGDTLTTRPDDLRPKLQALLSKWEGMTCRTKCAEELREVLEGAG